MLAMWSIDFQSLTLCLDFYRKGNHRLYWDLEPKEVQGKKIEFPGVPFYIMDCKILDWQHGKDRNAALKSKKQQQREEVSVYIHSISFTPGLVGKTYEQRNNLNFTTKTIIIVKTMAMNASLNDIKDA